jgi:hypothetical protein
LQFHCLLTRWVEFHSIQPASLRPPHGPWLRIADLSSVASFFLTVLFVALTKLFFARKKNGGELDPIRRAADGPRRIQISHSREMISTTLVRLLRPRCGRSVIFMCPSRRASCMVVCTVVRHTPASAAILSIGRSRRTPAPARPASGRHPPARPSGGEIRVCRVVSSWPSWTP